MNVWIKVCFVSKLRFGEVVEDSGTCFKRDVSPPPRLLRPNVLTIFCINYLLVYSVTKMLAPKFIGYKYNTITSDTVCFYLTTYNVVPTDSSQVAVWLAVLGSQFRFFYSSASVQLSNDIVRYVSVSLSFSMDNLIKWVPISSQDRSLYRNALLT